MPATDIFEIADTVIVRPDPVAVAAWVARLFDGAGASSAHPRDRSRG
jgi:hypothetical protein